jgi:hypothetical protein
VEWLPVYELKAAASEFGPSVAADCLGWMATPKGVTGDERYFVSQVFGRSMEPLIPDGSYCVFRGDVAGTRVGNPENNDGHPTAVMPRVACDSRHLEIAPAPIFRSG